LYFTEYSKKDREKFAHPRIFREFRYVHLTGTKRKVQTMAGKFKRDTQREALIAQTARITGYTKRYVKYVLEGQRRNEMVMSVYMTLLEASNSILKEVKRLIPFWEPRMSSKAIHRTSKPNQPK